MDVPAPRPATGITGRQLTLAPRPDRLIKPILAAAGVHLLLTLALLLFLDVVQPRAAGGTVPAAALIIVVTAVLAVITTLRSRAHGLDWTTRTAPAVFGLLPPLASVLALPVIVATGTSGVGHLALTVTGGPEGLEMALPLVVAVLAATTAPGLAIALTLEQALATVAARDGSTLRLTTTHDTDRDGPQAPRQRRKLMPASLAGKLARLAGGLALASSLLLLAHALLHGADTQRWLSHGPSYLALLGTAGTVVMAVLAAASAGLSPGRDVRSLAARLDAIGWDDEREPGTSMIAHRRVLADPVRVTSFDTVGELFRNLERLRARLAEDVRTYQRALDRTRAADAVKGEFLAAVSHELRTPLNSILGFAQLLLETDLNASQIEDVRLILAGGRQLHDLIEDILDMSMIESGELDLRFAPCDLCQLVEELVDIHKAQVREGAVELRAELALYVPPINCDRRRIAQVLTNLLSNAIKFTEAGRVTVRVSTVNVAMRDDEDTDEDEATLRIEVIDTGIGIADDELQHIFEEYQQAGSRKRRLRGTGLGLAIARRIVQAHGGTLEASSTLGKGSTFCMQLPFAGSGPSPSSSISVVLSPSSSMIRDWRRA